MFRVYHKSIFSGKISSRYFSCRTSYPNFYLLIVVYAVFKRGREDEDL